jgi:hypothetical protein
VICVAVVVAAWDTFCLSAGFGFCLNIGREGQVHLEVPQGYSNPTIPQGYATKP